MASLESGPDQYAEQIVGGVGTPELHEVLKIGEQLAVRGLQSRGLAIRALILRIVGGDADRCRPAQPRPVPPRDAHQRAADGHGKSQSGLGEVEDSSVAEWFDQFDQQACDHVALPVDSARGERLLEPDPHLGVPGRVGHGELPSTRRVVLSEQVHESAAFGGEDGPVTQDAIGVFVGNDRPESVVVVHLLPVQGVQGTQATPDRRSVPVAVQHRIDEVESAVVDRAARYARRVGGARRRHE